VAEEAERVLGSSADTSAGPDVLSRKGERRRFPRGSQVLEPRIWTTIQSGVRRHIGKHGGKSGFSRYAAQVDLDQGIRKTEPASSRFSSPQ
jgi:hypothetical protein